MYPTSTWPISPDVRSFSGLQFLFNLFKVSLLEIERGKYSKSIHSHFAFWWTSCILVLTYIYARNHAFVAWFLASKLTNCENKIFLDIHETSYTTHIYTNKELSEIITYRWLFPLVPTLSLYYTAHSILKTFHTASKT